MDELYESLSHIREDITNMSDERGENVVPLHNIPLTTTLLDTLILFEVRMRSVSCANMWGKLSSNYFSTLNL